ncbi:hypothetical protein SANTM175S_09910 [Streptomyces antimycoticus]
MPELTSAQARERFARARLAAAGDPSAPRTARIWCRWCSRVTGDTVVTAVDHKPKRTTRLKRLDNLCAHPAVCLLVDDYDENWDHLWWARGDGTARVLPPADESALSSDYVRLLVDTYPVQYRDRPPRGRSWRSPSGGGAAGGPDERHRPWPGQRADSAILANSLPNWDMAWSYSSAETASRSVARTARTPRSASGSDSPVRSCTLRTDSSGSKISDVPLPALKGLPEVFGQFLGEIAGLARTEAGQRRSRAWRG